MSFDDSRIRMPRVRLLVMAKQPVAGRVKTRLCPPFSYPEAAELAAAAIADTLAAVFEARAIAARRGLEVEPVLLLDGEPQDWLPKLLADALEGPAELHVLPQRGTGLDSRLAAAFQDAAEDCPGLLIGMDTPQVTARMLVDAMTTLAASDCDAVLGHADDGGWWALGLRRSDPSLLLGVPMSTSFTGVAQQARLDACGLRLDLLEQLRDVDTAEDAEHVAAQAPGSHFARSFERLRPTASIIR